MSSIVCGLGVQGYDIPLQEDVDVYIRLYRDKWGIQLRLRVYSRILSRASIVANKQ